MLNATYVVSSSRCPATPAHTSSSRTASRARQIKTMDVPATGGQVDPSYSFDTTTFQTLTFPFPAWAGRTARTRSRRRARRRRCRSPARLLAPSAPPSTRSHHREVASGANCKDDGWQTMVNSDGVASRTRVPASGLLREERRNPHRPSHQLVLAASQPHLAAIPWLTPAAPAHPGAVSRSRCAVLASTSEPRPRNTSTKQMDGSRLHSTQTTRLEPREGSLHNEFQDHAQACRPDPCRSRARRVRRRRVSGPAPDAPQTFAADRTADGAEIASTCCSSLNSQFTSE